MMEIKDTKDDMNLKDEEHVIHSASLLSLLSFMSLIPLPLAGEDT